MRTCGSVVCDNEIPASAPSTKKYCSKRCQRAQHYRRKRQRDKVGEATHAEIQRLRARRGKYYQKAVDLGLRHVITGFLLPDSEIAEALGCDRRTIGTIRQAMEEDQVIEARANEWVPADDTLRDFPEFRQRFFKDAAGKPYETRDFHMRWIQAILQAQKDGGRLMILSPPRHGKTDLLTHFCVWQIVSNPNIRIGWVGGNEDIAKLSVTAVMDHLENNQELLEAYLPPGEAYKPASRSGKSWSAGQFTVANRTVTGIRAPTMVAVGRGGRILSRDMDIIIADDIEDFQSTVQPSARNATRNWMTTSLASRKEEHTSLIIIGSRQHPDDLYGHLLDNPEWSTIVEHAHALECPLPEEDEKLHTGCVLWPKKRTFRWLMQQKRDSVSGGGEGVFDMVYLNKPIAEGIMVFTKDMLEAAKDETYTVGEIPPGVNHLVGGLDPAGTGYQSAWLWGFDIDNEQQYCIDIENHRGGGVVEAERVMKRWLETYGLKHWVVEENPFNKAIRLDRSLREWRETNNVMVEPHQTHMNKWDDIYGVTAMAKLFVDPKTGQCRVHIPWGDERSRVRMTQAVRQFLMFAAEPGQRKGSKYAKSDLVMAAWFPQKVWTRMTKEKHGNEAQVEYAASYQGYALTGGNAPPWA